MNIYKVKNKKFKSLDNSGYFDIFEILNNQDNIEMETYQMEKQNSNSFNWGFFAGLLLSSAFWVTVIYNVI